MATDIPSIGISQVTGLVSALANKLGTGLTDGYLFVGNVANAAVGVAMSQDGTLDNTGALTISNGVISFAKMQDITYQTLMGRWSAGNGPPQEIAIGAGLSLSGAGVLSASGGGGGSTANSAFTLQTSVTITHSLGYYPLVQVIDDTGALIAPLTTTHGSVNDFTVTFSTSTSGTIIYN